MALLTQGFIKVQHGASEPLDYTTIPGGLELNGGGFSPNDIDATDFDTEPGTRESIPGPRENNPYTMTFHYDPTDETQEALFAAEAANTPAPFRITMGTVGTGKQLTFTSVPSLTLSAPVDGKVTYSMTFKPTAKPVRGPLVA